MQKRVLLVRFSITLIGVVALTGVTFLLTRNAPPKKQRPEPAAAKSAEAAAQVGKVALALGTLEYRQSDESGWQALAENAALAPGMRIRTGTASRATLDLDDDSVVRLDEATEISIIEVTRSNVRLGEASGTVYYRVTGNPNRTFVVKTVEGSLTALGTAFAVERDATKKLLNLHVIENKVLVELQNGKNKLQKEVGQGMSLAFDPSKPPTEGVTLAPLDVKTLMVKNFYDWSLREDAKKGNLLDLVAKDEPTGDGAVKAKPAERPVKIAAPATTDGTLKLSGTVSEITATLNWETNGADASRGWKLVKSTEPNPVYPGNDSQYISEPNARSFVWGSLPAATTVHFRVCVYNGDGACLAYSNDFALLTGPAPAPAQSPTGAYISIAGELNLSVAELTDGVKLAWTPRTPKAFAGYKVVRSETDSDPYYPKSGYRAFVTDASATQWLDAEAVVGKTYYYRVCSLTSDGSPTACGNTVRFTVH